MAIGRYHPDHLAAGQATIMALYPASQNPWDFPELLDEGLKPHKVKEVYITGAPHVNYFVDISDLKRDGAWCFDVYEPGIIRDRRPQGRQISRIVEAVGDAMGLL